MMDRMLFVALLAIQLFSSTKAATQQQGDIFLNFAAASPLSYVHSKGGGAWNTGVVGINTDISLALTASSFSCGDTVSFLLGISTTTNYKAPPGGQILFISFAFDSSPTGSSGIGYTNVISVSTNYGLVSGGRGNVAQGTCSPATGLRIGNDCAVKDNGDGAVKINQLSFPPSTFTGQVTLNLGVGGIEANETIIIRIDTALTCQVDSLPFGDLSARLLSAQAIDNSWSSTQVQQITMTNVNEVGGSGRPEFTIQKTITSGDGNCGSATTSFVSCPCASVLFCYTVANTGTQPAQNISITDDNGTPNNVTDDILVHIPGTLLAGNSVSAQYLQTAPVSGISAGTVTGISTVSGNFVLPAFSNSANITFAPQSVTILSSTPTEISQDCTSPIPSAVSLSISDTCSASHTSIIPTESIEYTGIPGCTANYIITRTWQAVDFCGNVRSSVSQIIRIADTEAPILTMVDPLSVDVTCNQTPSAPVYTVNDRCSNWTSSVSSITGTLGQCGGVQSRTITATDSCGNQFAVTQTINVVDLGPPVITSNVPADITVSCSSEIPPVASITAVDQCAGSLTISPTQITIPNSGNCPADYDVVRTWTVSDGCGFSLPPINQTIRVRDTVAPIIQAPPDTINIQCIGTSVQTSLPVMPTLIATDNCGNNFTAIGYDEITDTNPNANANTNTSQCTRIVRRTWGAVDQCGNVAQNVSQVIIVSDTVPPNISAPPAGVSLQCTKPPAPQLTVTDPCFGSQQLSAIDFVLFQDPVCPYRRTLQRRWFYIDACSLSASVVQSINVTDTGAPVISSAPPTDVIISCSLAVPPAINLTANDQCEGTFAVVPVQSPPIHTGSPNCSNTVINRTWTPIDKCGNIGTPVVQRIYIQDNIAPTVSLTSNILTLECAAPIPDPQYTVQDCSSVNVTFTTPSTVTNQCSTTVNRIITAIDGCGNPTSVTQSLLITDTTPPTFQNTSLIANVTISCSDPIPPIQNLTAIDACSGTLQILPTEVRVDGNCRFNYELIRKWIPVDSCGNTGPAFVQVISVRDSQGPVISNPPASATTGTCALLSSAPPVLSAIDNCGGTFNATAIDSLSTNSCEKIIKRLWFAVDECGNTGPLVTQTISINDTSVPALASAPVTDIVQCKPPLAATLASVDPCLGSVNVESHDLVIFQDPLCPWRQNITRTWSYGGSLCQNQVSVTQNISIFDTQPPALPTAPPNVEVECGSQVPPTVPLFTLDACDGQVSVIPSDVMQVSITCSSNYVITRTWTPRDACGNSAQSVTQTITVRDTTPPNLTLASPEITVACGTTNLPDAMFTVHDACSAVSTSITTGISTTNARCGDVIQRTVTATDACGNIATATQRIKIMSSANYSVSSTPSDSSVNVTLECGALVSSAVTPVVVATDSCGTQTTLQFTTSQVSVPGMCSANYDVVRQWTTSSSVTVDNITCGSNSVVFVQNISVRDTQPPSFLTLPPNSSITCTSPLPEMTPIAAVDGCTQRASIVNAIESHVPGSCDGNFSIIRTYEAVDECGNSIVYNQTIRVYDVSPPILLNVPANVTAGCTILAGLAPAVTAVDDCHLVFSPSGSKILPVTLSEEYSLSPCSGYIIRRWNATDTCGNVATAYQHITFADTLPPVLIGVPRNVTASCTQIVPIPNVTAVDECTPNIPVIFSEHYSNNSCPRTITRTWVATDACNNTAVAVQVITIIDNTPPSLPPQANGVYECSVFNQLPVNLTAVDNCLGQFSVTGSDVKTNITCAYQYTIHRTWTATDSCNPPTVVQQIINVVDGSNPSFLNLPSSMLSLECGSETISDIPTATHPCDPNVTVNVISTVLPGGTACSKTLQRQFVATDACGNSNTFQQFATVQDTKSPVLENLPNQSMVITSCTDVPAVPPVVARDACQGNVSANFLEQSSRDACTYTLVRTWTATDGCVNDVSFVQTIIVRRDVPPTFVNAPSDVYLTCTSDPIPPIPTNVTAYDSCNSSISLPMQFQQTGNLSCTSVITRTWNVTDFCGNRASVSQVISVGFGINGPPILVSVPLVSLQCGDPIPPIPEVSAPTVCTSGPVFQGPTETTSGDSCHKVIVREWQTADVCGNVGKGNQTIHIIDSTAPTVTFTPPLTSLSISCSQLIEVPTFTVSDSCNSFYTMDFKNGNFFRNSTNSTQNVSLCGVYSTARVWTITDNCGNVREYRQNLTVTDDSSECSWSSWGSCQPSCGSSAKLRTCTCPSECSCVKCFGHSRADCLREINCTRTVQQWMHSKQWTVDYNTNICCGSSCWSYLTVLNLTTQPQVQPPSWLLLAQAWVVAQLNIKSFTSDPLSTVFDSSTNSFGGDENVLSVNNENWLDVFVWTARFINHTENWCGQIDPSILTQIQMAISTLNEFNSGHAEIPSCAGDTSPNDAGCAALLEDTHFPELSIISPPSHIRPSTPTSTGVLNRFSNSNSHTLRPNLIVVLLLLLLVLFSCNVLLW